MGTITNGQIRKSLSSQLDRLDVILDGLSEGLNDAVAMTVQQAVTGAVEAAVTEVLTNPTLQQRLRQRLHENRPNPIAQTITTLYGWLKAGCGKVAGWLSRAFGKTVAAAAGCKETACGKVAHVCRKVRDSVKGLWMRTLLALTLASRLRKTLLAALAAGLTIGLGCYFAGPVVSSMVSGVAGFVGSLAAGTMSRLRELLGGEKLPGT